MWVCRSICSVRVVMLCLSCWFRRSFTPIVFIIILFLFFRPPFFSDWFQCHLSCWSVIGIRTSRHVDHFPRSGHNLIVFNLNVIQIITPFFVSFNIVLFNFSKRFHCLLIQKIYFLNVFTPLFFFFSPNPHHGLFLFYQLFSLEIGNGHRSNSNLSFFPS